MNVNDKYGKLSHAEIQTTIDIITNGQSTSNLPSPARELFIDSLRAIASSDLTPDEKYTAIGTEMEKVGRPALPLRPLDVQADIRAHEHYWYAIEMFNKELEYGLEKPTVSEAISVAGIAVLHQREIHHQQTLAILGEALEKLSDIAEAFDFIASSQPSHKG